MLHSQDFYGDEYQSHNSCMSEDQRYSKEGRGGWDPSKGQVRPRRCWRWSTWHYLYF